MEAQKSEKNIPRKASLSLKIMRLLSTAPSLVAELPASASPTKNNNMAPRAAQSAATLAIPTTEVARLEAEYIHQMEALEVLPHRIQSRKFNDDIYAKQSQIYTLEQESAAALDGLSHLETEYATLKANYDQDLQQMHEKEHLARRLFSDAEISNTRVDKIRARKAELEAAELRPSILRQSITIDELDMAIQEKNSRSADAEDKIDVLKVKTENDRAILSKVEQHFKVFIPSFTERLPPDNEQSLGNIKASIENMVAMLMESLVNAEILLETATDAEKRVSGSTCDLIEQTVNSSEKRRKPLPRKTHAQLYQEVEEAQKKVEEMVPLYWVGHNTRAWRMERLRSKKMGRQGNSDLATACWSAANEANAKADATMDEDFEDQQEDYSSSFQALYGVPVYQVWEHRNFTMFIDIVNWGADMFVFQHHYSCDNFWPCYNKLMASICPDFKINSNAALLKDSGLIDAYHMLETERNNGLEIYRSVKMTKSNSTSLNEER